MDLNMAWEKDLGTTMGINRVSTLEMDVGQQDIHMKAGTKNLNMAAKRRKIRITIRGRTLVQVDQI
jgi:hypothetical protein